MKELDRERPMEAVHKRNGQIGVVRFVQGSKALTVGGAMGEYQCHFDKYGQPKDDFCPWVVRNVQSYADAVVELGDDRSKPPSSYEEAIMRVSAYHAHLVGAGIKVADNTTLIDRALAERLTGLARDLAGEERNPLSPHFHHWVEARAIAALLPAVVDDDLIEARKICGENRLLVCPAIQYERGFRDTEDHMKIALASIKRARELEAGR